MQKINLSNLNFLISNKERERRTLARTVSRKELVPISVNGVVQEYDKEREEIKSDINEFIKLTNEIITLKNKLNEANYKSGVMGFLNEVKAKRAMLSEIEFSAYSQKNQTKVEQGNIIKYEILEADLYEEKAKALQKEVEALSLKIDEINNSYEVEID